MERPHVLPGGRASAHPDPRVAAHSALDLRVSMVLAVLGGRSVESVAREWDLESSLVHRWVRDFLVAGTAAVTNRPDPDDARQRDRFLAAFAHELRSPVTVAQGWGMVLADGEVDPDDVGAAVGHITGALDRLSEHILDVELAASASLGRLPLAARPVAVAELCRDLPGSPGVREGADLTVFGDPDLLRRVLRDLWSTACGDPAPDSVAIDVVATGSWHEIRVVREGIGLSPMVLKASFDPFGANNDATGVTMGLYMARALTVAHGGVLGAEGDDNRTVLYTRIPREPSVGTGATGPRSDPTEGEPR